MSEFVISFTILTVKRFKINLNSRSDEIVLIVKLFSSFITRSGFLFNLYTTCISFIGHVLDKRT